jgi:hypothetical protein
METGIICKNNWSGTDIYKNDKTQEHTNKIFNALNKPDYQVWLEGFAGMFLGIRKWLRVMVEDLYFENLILISVVLNTFVLAMDGTITD